MVVYNNERDLPSNFVNKRDSRDISRQIGLGNNCSRHSNGAVHGNGKTIGSYLHGKNVEHASESSMQFINATNADGGYRSARNHKDYEKIWRLVLENIESDMLKQFLFQEGKLITVSFGSAPTVQLILSSPVNKAKAEKFRGQILQAFESTLHSEVILEIRCESRREMTHSLLDMVPYENDCPMTLRHQPVTHENCTESFPKDNVQGIGSCHAQQVHTNMANSEITEIVDSPKEQAEIGLANGIVEHNKHGPKNVWHDGESSLQHGSNLNMSRSREREEQHQRQRLVRAKVSLAHIIQQAEGCAQRGGWSRRKAISIAEKLEQENLRLEPKSRSLLCWRVPRIRRRKLPHVKMRTQRPRYLLKMVTCGQCLS